MCAGIIKEVIDHVDQQEKNAFVNENNTLHFDFNNQMLELLFNQPPFPIDGDISLKSKIFYVEKGNNIIKEIIDTENNNIELEFEYDLNKSDIQLIKDVFELLKNQSFESYENNILKLDSVSTALNEINRKINIIEAGIEDEEILRYSNGMEETKRHIVRLIENKGALQNQIKQLHQNIESNKRALQIALNKIDVSEKKQRKYYIVNKYIQTLKTFIDEQKADKCAAFETAILEELQKLMHKLQNNQNNFIAAVKVTLLPDDDGLNILLYNNNGEIRHKEMLSQGEKQIYISCLIKAIIALSIKEFPVFIDTPLGKLDDEHIKNTLLNYYPDLSSQVVLMATSNEIPQSRYKLLIDKVALAYTLENENNNTTIKKFN